MNRFVIKRSLDLEYKNPFTREHQPIPQSSCNELTNMKQREDDFDDAPDSDENRFDDSPMPRPEEQEEPEDPDGPEDPLTPNNYESNQERDLNKKQSFMNPPEIIIPPLDPELKEEKKLAKKVVQEEIKEVKRPNPKVMLQKDSLCVPEEQPSVPPKLKKRRISGDSSYTVASSSMSSYNRTSSTASDKILKPAKCNSFSEKHKSAKTHNKSHVPSKLVSKVPAKEYRWGESDINENYLLDEFAEIEELKNKKLTQTVKHRLHFPIPYRRPYFLKTLIIDLDETLIYVDLPLKASEGAQKEEEEIPKEIQKCISVKKKIPFIVRPGAVELLEKMHPFYEIIIYSSGTEGYVWEILESIEGLSEYIDLVLTYQHCEQYGNIIVKNANILADRDLDEIIIIDDKISYWPKQLDNIIPIKPFFPEEVDTAVMDKIEALLQALGRERNVRRYIAEEFKIKEKYKQFQKELRHFIEGQGQKLPKSSRGDFDTPRRMDTPGKTDTPRRTDTPKKYGMNKQINKPLRSDTFQK